MRADICDPEDDEAVERLRLTLRKLGPELAEKSWGLGVGVCRLMIGNQELTIFSDAWSIDVEGPVMSKGQTRWLREYYGSSNQMAPNSASNRTRQKAPPVHFATE